MPTKSKITSPIIATLIIATYPTSNITTISTTRLNGPLIKTRKTITYRITT
jgi:hypothetical protein